MNYRIELRQLRHGTPLARRRLWLYSCATSRNHSVDAEDDLAEEDGYQKHDARTLSFTLVKQESDMADAHQTRAHANCIFHLRMKLDAAFVVPSIAPITATNTCCAGRACRCEAEGDQP